MTTFAEVTHSIMFDGYSNDELTGIIDAVAYRRKQLANETKRQLSVGSNVKFTNSRNGTVVVGFVQKINQKFVIVKQERGGYLPMTWRVPANMLEVQ